MNFEDISILVCEIIQENFGCIIVTNKTLLESVGISDNDDTLIDLAILLEKKFDICISDPKIQKCKSVIDISIMVSDYLNKKNK